MIDDDPVKIGEDLKLSAGFSGHERIRPDATSYVYHGTFVKTICAPTIIWYSVKKEQGLLQAKHLSAVILI